MVKNVFSKIPYTLLINILYLVSIFFILISIDNCIWFNYKFDKTIIYDKNNLNYYNNKIISNFIKIIDKLLDNLRINGSLNFICMKTNININNLYDLYKTKINNESHNEIENELINKLESNLQDRDDKNKIISKIEDKNSGIDKYVKEYNISVDHCFYINKNLKDNLKQLLLQKLDEIEKKRQLDIYNIKDDTYKKDILQKNNSYISVAKENVNLFFEENKDNFEKISILMNVTNYIKTAYKICVLFIAAKLLLSIFTGKRWLSLIIIPFLLITGYFVFYFIKDNINIGIPKGVSIEGVGITNMLVGTIFFYVSLLLNLVF